MDKDLMDKKLIVYQMLPRLWNSGKRPGEDFPTGRFPDIDDSFLGYLKSLGVTHLWLTGVIRHATTVSFDGMPSSLKQVVKGDAGSPYAIV
ncbi:MAG: alpha-amylase, partial [Candidatus Cryptobacteroides sp.]